MRNQGWFSVSKQLRPELSAKLILSIFSALPFTRKLRKNVYFSILQIKLTKPSILPNCQVPNRSFWHNCKFLNGNKIPNFVSDPWKLENPYCHSIMAGQVWLKRRKSRPKICKAELLEKWMNAESWFTDLNLPAGQSWVLDGQGIWYSSRLEQQGPLCRNDWWHKSDRVPQAPLLMEVFGTQYLKPLFFLNLRNIPILMKYKVCF